METEEPIEEVAEDSIRADLERAFDEVEAPVGPKVETPKEEPSVDRTRDESGKFAKKNETAAKTASLVSEKVPDAPNSWKDAEKAEWANMTPGQRAAVIRREEEVHLGFTKLDEDRTFGKSLKEIVQPYMPIIQAEGGTPQTAIQSLLNTAYILRTAPIEQKTALFHQLAQQYGVNLSQSNNTSPAQPNDLLAQTQRELAELRQQIQQQPEVFKKQQESLAVKSAIDAFSADPKNVHFEKLKPVMASLLQTGQAKDLQEAYDKASWADPDIRPAFIAAQQNAADTQRIADIKAKANKAQRASVSLKGYPSVAAVANGKGTDSIADDIRAAWEEHVA